MSHAVNCDCLECTNGDNHLIKLKRSVGQHAAWRQSIPFSRHGVRVFGVPMEGKYGRIRTPVQHADEVKADIKSMTSAAIFGFLGDVVQAKKEGQNLPPFLDKIANLGIKTETAAKGSALSMVQKETGKKVLKFAPFVLGAIALLVLFFMYKTHRI